MLSDRRLLQMQMQLWAACSDDIAHGMLLNVAAALDLESQRDKSWVRRLLGMEPSA
jgi:hypothetical protein